MRTLDRYIIKNFLSSFIIFLVVMMGLRVAADMSLNMDEFTKTRETRRERAARALADSQADRQADSARPPAAAAKARSVPENRPFREALVDIGVYYSHQALVYFRELSGVIIVAAAAFALARMNHTNELTAILASGQSLHRVLLPILLTAIALNVLVLVDSELLIPPAKQQLVRTRDDVSGADSFQVRLVTDIHRNCWYSPELTPKTRELVRPIVFLRDSGAAHVGHLTAAAARYDPDRREWVFLPAPPRRPDEPPEPPRLFLKDAQASVSSDFVPTRLSSRMMIEHAVRRHPEASWPHMASISQIEIYGGPAHRLPKENAFEDDTYPHALLRIDAARLNLAVQDNQLVGTSLEDVAFRFQPGDGEAEVCLKAPRANYEMDPATRQYGWRLTGGSLRYACDLDPDGLALRQSSSWLQYMSTGELNRLLRLQRLPDRGAALLVKHARFADFFNNIILLLVAVPFLLSRERNIKSSAGLTVLTVGLVYVCIYLSRYLVPDPVLATWLPLLIFGTLGAVMVDSVKT